jgi:hypothetical protein
MAEQQISDSSNHAGVWIPPPLLYVLPLLLAQVLQIVIPLPFLPPGIVAGAAVLSGASSWSEPQICLPVDVVSSLSNI